MRRFWNHILTWRSVRLSRRLISWRCSRVTNSVLRNSVSSSWIWIFVYGLLFWKSLLEFVWYNGRIPFYRNEEYEYLPYHQASSSGLGSWTCQQCQCFSERPRFHLTSKWFQYLSHFLGLWRNFERFGDLGQHLVRYFPFWSKLVRFVVAPRRSSAGRKRILHCIRH